MSKIDKIRTIESICSGELDPLREKRKIWMFQDGEIFRILESGDLVRANFDHFQKYNGVNDVFFRSQGDLIPEDVKGQVITCVAPDRLHNLAGQYLKLGNKNFKLKKK